MVTLTALRPLSGKYGHVHPNETFNTTDEIAEQLEMRGLARRYYAPVYEWKPTPPLSYETKIIEPVPAVEVSTHIRKRK